MKITTKREITYERERRVTIRFGDSSAELFCASCEAIVRFLTIDEAAVLKQLTAREIFRLVESGGLHFAETKSGGLLICFASLSGAAQENDLKILKNHNDK